MEAEMRKINNLLFCIEPIEYFDGYEKKKFNAFYYMVDGKKIDFGSSFQPASKYEILENEADYIDEEYRMVILNCCSCGMWECDSYVAKVIERQDTVEWFIHRIRDDSENTPDYVFDREQYEMTISKMRTAAKAEFGTGCIFYWKDGDSYCYVPDDDIDILDYWKQQKEQKYPLEYFERIENGELFVCKDGKIIPYIKAKK